ncbi:thioredoxin family protein [Bhargavaea ullalensis]|uniref:Thiol-disulfide isomerase/thioredoxin n=1 Tax=Bhargavaea ullalensis TaxID=1265685 RepID=A0ABV2GDI1_9BACL
MEQLKSMDQFTELKQDERVVFMFTAGWCPDCRVIEPSLPSIEADYPEFTFISVDRDEFIDLCGDLEVYGIPSFVVFHEGEEAGRFVSKDRKTKKQIESFLDSISVQ